MTSSKTPARLRGVLAPVMTPFEADMDVDVAAYIQHCQWLLDKGASLAIFGTNSEAASISADERMDLTETLLDAGIPAHRLMPGTGSCSVVEAANLSRHAVNAGAAGVLMLPPFYFKGVSDEGLFAYYSQVIERVGDARLAVYLYHIPQVTQVPISLSLIERLLKRYPETIAGCKDSSGDWGNAEAMIKAFAADGFDVFPASESLLRRAVPLGAAGCISATVNVNPGGIHSLYTALTHPRSSEADLAQLHGKADRIRQIFQSVPMIPAMKYTVATLTGQASWAHVRPPLVSMGDQEGKALLEKLSAEDFQMPGHT